MRRIILACLLTILSLGTTGALAPVTTHAQTTTPVVTVVPAAVTTGTTATVTGTGFTPNSYAYVYYQRPDGTYNAFYVTTDPTGAFSFTLGFLPSHGAGTEYVSAYDYATGRWAAFATVTVSIGTPPPSTLTLSTSVNPVRVGSSTTITGTGFTPNQYVYISWMRPDGTSNATYAYTGPTGQFAFTLGFLAIHGCGTETVRAYDYGTGQYSASLSITVSC